MVCLDVIEVLHYIYNNGKLLSLRYTEEGVVGSRSVTVEYTVGVYVEDTKYIYGVLKRKDIDYHVKTLITEKHPEGCLGYIKEFNQLTDLGDIDLDVMVKGVSNSSGVVIAEVYMYGEEVS